MSLDARPRPAMTLIGVETRAANDALGAIGELWQRFRGEGLSRAPGRLDDAVVAVYCEYESDHTRPYTFFLGCRVDADAQAPDGLIRRAVGAGRFVQFDAEGEQPKALIETWQAIWAAPLVRRFEADYEVHAADGRHVSIFVGV